MKPITAQELLASDPYFRVKEVASVPSPQRVCWLAMHQDYSEKFVMDEIPYLSQTEQWYGERVVSRCVERGHWGVCYDENTEVLTEEGWKFWREVKDVDKLAAVDISNYSMKFETPSALQQFEVNEELYHVTGTALDFAVTKNHRMVVEHRRKDGTFSQPYFATPVEKLNKPYRVRRSVNLADQRFDYPLPLLKLLGFWLGDGETRLSGNTIRFRLRRARKIKYLTEICTELGVVLSIKDSDRYVIKDELCSNFLKGFVVEGIKHLSLSILKLSSEGVEALLDGLKNSDGINSRADGTFDFDNCNLELLDTLQALVVINGYSANITENGRTKTENHRPCLRLRISKQLYARVEPCQKGRNPAVKETLISYQGKVYCATVSTGALMVRRNGKPLVSGNCEHPQLIVACAGFPHSVIQQIRTHRVGVSFDCQSSRYSGQRFLDESRSIEELVYLRPENKVYADRQGSPYLYTPEMRQRHLERANRSRFEYAQDIELGLAEEHARGHNVFDIRQNFVVSANLRSWLHLLMLRHKKDAQIECQAWCEAVLPILQNWAPQILEHWVTKGSRLKLAP
jgi:thymidylate synthase (FAD)